MRFARRRLLLARRRRQGVAVGRALALERDGRVLRSRVLDRCNRLCGQDAVESEGIGYDTGNITKEVTHPGIGRVLGTIQGGSNGDGLGVDICDAARN